MRFVGKTWVVIILVQVMCRGLRVLNGRVTAQEYACDFVILPFCDTTSSIDSRVQDLLSRLTLDEKIQQLVNKAAAVPRLGIPSYEWWNEALHGVANSPGVTFTGAINAATSFPQPILTAASFNTTLFNKIGQVISTEAVALHNLGHAGLTYWTPNINIFRDPRWGRGQETPGEDPTLSGSYAAYFVRGMQEGDYDGSAAPIPSKLKTSACCKHWTAYDLDRWEGVLRYDFNAIVTQQDLDDTYNPPFQSCIQGGAASCVMCSYNMVNGVPACASYELLTQIARTSWGLQGYIVSDCDAVSVLYTNTKYAATPEDAVMESLLAGMDVNCGNWLLNYTGSAVTQGKVTEANIDTALYNAFTVQMRLGLFDGNPQNLTHGGLGAQDVCTEEHQSLALEAALQGIVLLKNDDGVLPFSQTLLKSVAVIGPNANDSLNTMLGNYAGYPCSYSTPTDAIGQYVGNLLYHPGCADVACTGNDLISSAAALGASTDAAILVVGLSQEQEREDFDRTSLLLPGYQEQLVRDVVAAAAGPVVLVIMSGGPVDITFAKNDSGIHAILWVGYPGEAGGQALAQILFGEHNPGGRLPSTWYPEELTNWPMTNMNMRPDNETGYPGRTYRFYTGEAVYKFGYGLSYNTVQRSFTSAPTSVILPNIHNQACFHQKQTNLPLSQDCSSTEAQACSELNLQVEISVENLGNRRGTDVLILYTSSPTGIESGNPLKQLVAFRRLHMEALQAQRIVVTLQPCVHFATVKSNGGRSVDPGDHSLTIGDDEDVHYIHFSISQ